ncbi:serine hydrolase domain-containing protein [Winogradskyella luteola]|uniref:Beta-lactamase family protein n=1 Tax=Winogradskyella luteola TaxID=2828330 RepID=A0A9X1FA04_9FLAO|nr:serine hydrolase domain-containing protein [Winogradskyella luteola]MBV7268700.1 beta-lactamase family protein [Winogradskyella luteola]
MKFILTSFLLVLITCNLFCQQTKNSSRSKTSLYHTIDSLLANGYQSDMYPGASAVVFQNDSLLYFNYGRANIEKDISVSENTLFQLGSIGKILTVIAVLQQVDLGVLDLDADISEYIDFKTLTNKKGIISLRCLLTHTCSFNDVNIGYMSKNSKDVLSLQKFVIDYYPDIFQPVGTEIIYSNYSYALAGFIIEKTTGINFKRYIKDSIFKPLGMSNSSLDFPDNYSEISNYAIPYNKLDDKFKPTTIFPRHAIPAGSLVSNSLDMGKFIRALFKQDVTLLNSSSWDLLYSQQFTNHKILNGYSLGMEQQNINGNESWAKGGMLPGMLSGILIKSNDFAVFLVENTNSDEFGEYFFKSLFDIHYQNNSQVKSSIKKTNAKIFSGSYRDKRYNRKTIEKAATLFTGEIQLYVNATKDSLSLFHNDNWHDYAQVHDGIFQCADIPESYLVFKKDNSGNLSMYRSVNINGLSVPTSYEKLGPFNNSSFFNEQYPINVMVIISGFLFSLLAFVFKLLRLKKKNFLLKYKLPNYIYIIIIVISSSIIFHSIKGVYYLFQYRSEFLFGVPKTFAVATTFAYLLIPLMLLYFGVLMKIYKNKTGTFCTRIFLAVYGTSIICHLAFLKYWNFV